MDPGLEVPVTRKHGHGHESLGLDRFGDRVGQGPAVPDAGGAAIADGLETKLVEVRRKACRIQIVRHHPRARCQAGLDPRLRCQPFFDRLLGQEPRADHDRRVRGVGATRDRGDHDRAVPNVARGRHGVGGARRAKARQVRGEVLRHVDQSNQILGSLWTRQARRDGREIQGHRIRKHRVRRLVGAEQPVFLAVPLGPFDDVGRPAGPAEVVDGLSVHGEESHGGAVLRGHVGDRGPVGQAKA